MASCKKFWDVKLGQNSSILLERLRLHTPLRNLIASAVCVALPFIHSPWLWRNSTRIPKWLLSNGHSAAPWAPASAAATRNSQWNLVVKCSVLSRKPAGTVSRPLLFPMPMALLSTRSIRLLAAVDAAWIAALKETHVAEDAAWCHFISTRLPRMTREEMHPLLEKFSRNQSQPWWKSLPMLMHLNLASPSLRPSPNEDWSLGPLFFSMPSFLKEIVKGQEKNDSCMFFGDARIYMWLVCV